MASTKKPFLYLLTGDPFLRRHRLDSLLDEILPSDLRKSNLFRIYPPELNWAEVLIQAATPPLLGGPQVFLFAQADQLGKKIDWPSFGDFLAQPNPKNIFIFEADEVAKTHPAAKLAARFGLHEHFGGGRDADLGVEVLREKVRRNQKKMTPEAWRALTEKLGASLELMDQCLDQLILYSEEATITEADVTRLVSKYMRYEPFDLTEAIAARNHAKALEIFYYLYELSGDLTSIVGLLHWQLKRIREAKKILLEGGRASDVGRALRIPPFRLSLFIGQVRGFQLDRVEKLLRSLWQLDRDMKTGAREGQTSMESFLASV